ncbi:MAG TPA: sigma-70 family RNA polymerase sigma factor [Pseudonocardiaceae bacterium]|nr:sigma-70 family RNA polymerase sigma factor [Pseudonocardiaceae bacterium]
MRDAQLFSQTYELCYPNVLAYATSLVGRATGEDITSETFAVAWQRWAEPPSVPLPWLLAVARNLVRDLRRKDARQYELAVAEGRRISTEVGVDDIADDVAERATVLRALAGLPDADRELLTLLAWQGLSQRDAATVLGCSTATVAVRLHRARRRLDRAMGASGSSPEHHPLAVVKEP